MTNNKSPQNSENGLTEPTKSRLNNNTHGDVRQDKDARTRDHAASRQPDQVKKFTRSRGNSLKPHARHTSGSTTRQVVNITLWVKPIVKEELTRRAQKNGISLSSAGSAILERALQQTIDMEYGTLLEPVIRQEIRKQISAYSERIALLLVRNAFASEQTRHLVTNILSRQPDQHRMAPSTLEDILDASAKGARQKILLKTPQLESILKEVSAWLTENHEKTDEPSKEN